jgi:hypothetical protein
VPVADRLTNSAQASGSATSCRNLPNKVALVRGGLFRAKAELLGIDRLSQPVFGDTSMLSLARCRSKKFFPRCQVSAESPDYLP